MPDYRRSYVPGASYFFTVVTFERQRFLCTDLARNCLRIAWRETHRKYPFIVEAVVLLPDHLHCIWSLPDGDADFSSRWRMLKGVFSRRFLAEGGARRVVTNSSRRSKREAAVWQRRFWEHRLRDTDDFRRHVDYIHFNPVKHGHTDRAGDWPWSSLHQHVARGWYDPEWGIIEPAHTRGLSTVAE